MSNSIITNTHPNLTLNHNLSHNRIATITLFLMTPLHVLGPLIPLCQPASSRTSPDTPRPIPSPVLSPVPKGTVVGMHRPPHPTPVPVAIHTLIRVGLGTATSERARRSHRRRWGARPAGAGRMRLRRCRWGSTTQPRLPVRIRRIGNTKTGTETGRE